MDGTGQNLSRHYSFRRKSLDEISRINVPKWKSLEQVSPKNVSFSSNQNISKLLLLNASSQTKLMTRPLWLLSDYILHKRLYKGLTTVD